MTILVFRDKNEITFCYSCVSRRDRDFRKYFLVVEQEKMKLTLVENSRDFLFFIFNCLLFCYSELRNLTVNLNPFLWLGHSRVSTQRDG